MKNSLATKKPKKLSLSDWVGFVRRLENRRANGAAIEGSLTVANDDEVALLEGILARQEDTPCQVLDGDPDAIAVGRRFHLALETPRLGIGLVVKDPAVWLRHDSVRCGRAERWYLIDLDWMSGETGELSERYAAMLKLVALLGSSAAVVDEAKARLIFLPTERLDLPVRYGETALRSLSTRAVDELVSIVKMDDGHGKQRREILATAIRDMTHDKPEDIRFEYLVGNLEELTKRFRDAYGLFASAFSFEKVRDQMEAIRVEYTGKIHKVFSDIQGQLLGIPVSSIVVATQMKEVTGPGPAMWANIAVLLGAFVFGVLLALSIVNQWHTLDVLAQEIERQERITKKDHPDLTIRFTEVFASLRARLWHQRVVLVVVAGFDFLGVTLAFVVFWAITKPAINVFF